MYDDVLFSDPGSTVSGGDAGAPSGSAAAAETAESCQIDIPDYSEHFDQLEALIADQNELILEQNTLVSDQNALLTSMHDNEVYGVGLLLVMVIIIMCHYIYRFLRLFF